MKRLTLFLVLICIVSVLTVGCTAIFKNEDKECDHTLGNKPETPPSFEELAEINSYDKVLKTHKNMYLKSVITASDPEESCVQQMLLFQGDGKIDYHMRSTKDDGNFLAEDVSRIGNEWYYYDAADALYTVLELGESYILDYTLPDLFSDFITIGKTYLDGDLIVQHGYFIVDGFEEYPPKRYDYTYYFDKETKLIEKIESVDYDDRHTVIMSSVTEISYNVADAKELFDATLIDNVYASEKRIDLEIVVGYGTEEEKKYSLVSTTDALLYGVLDSKTYLMYTDPECQNQVMSLNEFVGEKTLTLYASELVFDDVIYTVTEEEWNAFTEYHNYTIEQVGNDYHLVHKYTEDALEMDEYTILFIGERQYYLEESENGYVAVDCTALDFAHDGLLAGAVYDEFVYDEELCAYVCDLTDEMGTRWEIRFENGVPVSMTAIITSAVDGVEETEVIQSYYTNVGTTVIEIPEYVIEEDEDANVRWTATEEEWDLCVSGGNFTATFFAMKDFKTTECSFKSTGNAIELDGKCIVYDNGKKYILEEIDGTWYASEWNDFDISATMIPAELSFDDFEYSEDSNMYVQKEDNGSGLFYSVKFRDGVLSYVMVQKSLDPADPGYLDVFGFTVTDIGSAVIEIPEYVITE